MTSTQSRSSARRTLKCTPSTHTYTKSLSLSDRLEKWRCSSWHWVVRRVITDAERPAELPKNPSSAGTKSPLDMPRKYSSGSTSVTFGDFRHHGGTIELLNWHRSPVSGSTRPSSTRGARISMRPAPVVIVRGLACPLRTTRRLPSSSTSSVNASMYASASASSAAAEHPTRAFPTDLIQTRGQLRARGLLSNYLQHRRSFLAGIGVPATLLDQAGRYAAPSNRPAIHNFWLQLA